MAQDTARLQPQAHLGSLKRELGLAGAIGLGLSSIVGTGVFVSLGMAIQLTGPSVVLGVVLAGLTATCNALNAAQLAACSPTSGGTYEYGYLYLTPWLGFTAGWTFLLAKCASSASAALGLSGYLLALLQPNQTHSLQLLTGIAVGVLVLLTAIVLGGIRKSNRFSFLTLGLSLGSLLLFMGVCLPTALQNQGSLLTPFFRTTAEAGARAQDRSAGLNFLEATALLFVAFTGYGRVATLGEEVKRPRVTIPRAIMISLALTALLYIAVALVVVSTVPSTVLDDVSSGGGGAPLAQVLLDLGPSLGGWSYTVVSIGAMTAMLGVLLSLILGLSRMVLAMSRRFDMPLTLGRVHVGCGTTTPVWAVLLVSATMIGLTLTGSVKTTWSFSAFTVLVYYAICNAAAIRMPDEHRLYPKVFGYIGCVLCLGLAVFVDWTVWLIGLGMIGVGLLWHGLFQRYYRPYAIQWLQTQTITGGESVALVGVQLHQVAPSEHGEARGDDHPVSQQR